MARERTERDAPRPAPGRSAGNTGGKNAPARAPIDPNSYGELSARPLHSLAFLAPLLVAFEFGSLLLIAQQNAGQITAVRAHTLLNDVFNSFGALGLVAPSLLIVAVLLTQHVLRRDPWKLRPGVLVGMLVESLAWALPLLVLAALFASMTPAAAVSAAQDTAAPLGQTADALGRSPWLVRTVVSLGAGLYEELLFRLVAITVLHMVLADLLRLGKNRSAWIAVALSAAAFALYHDPSALGAFASFSLPANWRQLAFLACAGLYLGAVYVTRGFGIAVGAHTAYDLIVLVVLPTLATAEGG